MVIAFIALLVAGGGVAAAAIPDSDDGEIHGCYANRNGALRVVDDQAGETCNASKETALVWNQQGPPGTPGTPGTPGSAGASALPGRATGGSFTAAQAAAANGTSALASSPQSVDQLSPNAIIVARDLVVTTRIVGTAEETATFTLLDDGSPTSVSCTIETTPGSSTPLSCNSGAATATIDPASALSLEITTSTTGTSNFAIVEPPVRFGWRATTP
jgi:hypothetical protein